MLQDQHVERCHLRNYEKGDVLRFSISHHSSLKSGDYATVIDVHPEQQLLTLVTEKGNEVPWQLPRYKKGHTSPVEVFRVETRELCIGDCIRWTRTDKPNHLLSAEIAHVIAIDRQTLTVKLSNEQLFALDTKKMSYQHWDHGYASTVYAAQGTTKSIVLAHLESFRKNLMTQPAFLVSLTRAMNSFRIYTDDKQQLLHRLLKNSGKKRSSLEVIGKYTLQNQKEENPQNKSSPNLISSKAISNTLPASRIRSLLNEHAEAFAITLLGKPVARQGNCLRFGSRKGSLIITIQGPKQGLWYDFSPSTYLKGKTGGDMLTLLQYQKNINFSEALKQAAEWLRLPVKNNMVFKSQRLIKRVEMPSPIIHHLPDSKYLIEQKKRIKFARQLVGQSRPLHGSLAEKYLRYHRGINLSSYPKDVRFHPGIYSVINGKTLPALLVVTRDQEGRIQGIQAIYLDKNTAKKATPPLAEISKQTFGIIKGTAITLQGSHQSVTLLAEGPETGLSIAQAIPEATVKVTLGKANLINIDTRSLSDKVILCLDNDGKDIKTDPIILAAVKKLTEEGKSVYIMIPRSLGAFKQDYNDVLQQKGIEAIRKDFIHAIPYEKFFEISLDKALIKTPIDPYKKNAPLEHPVPVAFPYSLKETSLSKEISLSSKGKDRERER